MTARGEPTVAMLGADAYRRAIAQAETLEDLYCTAVALRQEAEWQAAGRPIVSVEEVVRRG